MSRKPARSLSGLHVLVAEDDLLISQFIREILLDLECTVIGPAHDVDEALRAIRTNDIDSALLDVQLGQGNVYPATNELALRGIPFILMTGQGSLDEPPSHCATAPLLTKPFKVQQLEDMMGRTFRLGG